MNLLQDVQKIAVRGLKKKVPILKAGHTVKVHQIIKEGNKERVQIFEGLVIKINSGYGADKTFTVRRIVDGIGVEKIFPLYSPRIEKIEVVTLSKVRRAKLYYMRDRFGKSARLKKRFVTQEELDAQMEGMDAEPEKVEEPQKTEENKAENTEVAETKEEVKKETEVKAEEKAESKADKEEKSE